MRLSVGAKIPRYEYLKNFSLVRSDSRSEIETQIKVDLNFSSNTYQVFSTAANALVR